MIALEKLLSTTEGRNNYGALDELTHDVFAPKISDFTAR